MQPPPCRHLPCIQFILPPPPTPHPIRVPLPAVISRSFSVSVTDPNTGNPTPLAAYVPWACLINHSPNPNAVFAADLSPDRREFVVVPRLRYTPIESGFEVCISYGGGLDGRSTLLKYGFVSTGNVNDRLDLPPGMAEAAARLKQQAMIRCAFCIVNA